MRGVSLPEWTRTPDFSIDSCWNSVAIQELSILAKQPDDPTSPQQIIVDSAYVRAKRAKLCADIQGIGELEPCSQWAGMIR